MEGQVGVMLKADDELRSLAIRWLDAHMCVALAEPLIEVGHRSSLPTQSSSYLRPLC